MLAALLAGLVVHPSFAQAPSSRRGAWKVGFLGTSARPAPWHEHFFQGLGELGYRDGVDLVLEKRWAGGDNRALPRLAAELVASGVDVIVTAGTPATLAAKQATASIPIVFGSAALPVENGLVASLGSPNGNVTGLALTVSDIKTLDHLREAAPDLRRIAHLYDPATLPGPQEKIRLTLYSDEGRSRGLMLEHVPVRSIGEAESVIAALPDRTAGLLIASSAINLGARDSICAAAIRRGLPAIGTERAFADAGCLMSYGDDLKDLYRRAAGYVDRILRGARPADLPVEQSMRFELVINLKTARALDLRLPPSLLDRADVVIE